jgi:hypothetical protein
MGYVIQSYSLVIYNFIEVLGIYIVIGMIPLLFCFSSFNFQVLLRGPFSLWSFLHFLFLACLFGTATIPKSFSTKLGPRTRMIYIYVLYINLSV